MSSLPRHRKPTAVHVRRFIAHVIDHLVGIAAAVIPALLLSEKVTEAELVNRDPSFTASDYNQYDTFASLGDRVLRIKQDLYVFERKELIIIAAIAIGVTLLFEVIVQGRRGWSIGKLLTGLRTVNRSGDRPGILRALVRFLFLAIDQLPGLPLVGMITALVSPHNRRVGDHVAGTFVVGRNDMGDDPTGEGDLDTTGWTTLDEHPGHVTKLSEGEPLRVGGAAAATQTFDTRPAPAADEVDDDKAPAYQPQWDPARQAYLQWDPRKQHWLQFDDDSEEWVQID